MIGRYVVLDVLGWGGMGIVYAAFDPDLDRKIALKLLLPDRDRGEAARLRLQREAQAIARLSHPNVVAVHDVGTVEQGVFIAMEFVDGSDLAKWLDEAEPAPAEVLERFIQAGQGLAAAHAAGLVHRDFKPGNVLVGTDGRARVVDFGLVREDDSSASFDSSQGAGGPDLEVSQRDTKGADQKQLTEVGAIVGTPAYMSPEQFMGLPGDARSDQFSFCVSLYEGLYGERPFKGSNPAELSYSVVQGEIRPPPAQHRVPGRLRRVLLRGLATRPEERYPGMAALLGALRKASAPRRSWWIVPVVLGLAGLGVAAAWGGADEPEACDGADDRVAVLWAPRRQDELAQAFEQTRQPFAKATWERVRAQVDQRLSRWAEVHRQVCEDSRGLDPIIAAEDPRRRCLDNRLAETTDLLSVLALADQGTVTAAVQMVHGLSSVEDCAGFDVIDPDPTPGDPVLGEHVQHLRSELRRWRMRTQARGHDEETDAALDDLVEQGRAAGYEPLWAELLQAQAHQAEAQGKGDRAEALGNESFEAALGCRHDRLAVSVAADLAFWHGVEQLDPVLGHRWAGRATSLSRRIGNDPIRRVQLLSSQASIYAVNGRDEQARRLYDEALAAVRQLDDPVTLATVLHNIGSYHAQMRRLTEAREYLEESAILNDDVLGPDHPFSLRTRANLGIITVLDRRYEEGLALLEAVLPQQEAVLGEDSPDVANTLESIATALSRMDRHVQSLAARRRVLEIRRALHGFDGRPTIEARKNLASSLIAAGQHLRAQEQLEVLWPLVDALPPEEVTPRVETLVLRFSAALELGDAEPADPSHYVRAHRHAQRAYELCHASDRCSRVKALTSRKALGWASYRTGDHAAARTLFAAIVDRPPSEMPRWLRLDALRGLAAVTYADDPDGALALARRAMTEAQAAPRSDLDSQRVIRMLERWLADHDDSSGRDDDVR